MRDVLFQSPYAPVNLSAAINGFVQHAYDLVFFQRVMLSTQLTKTHH